MAWVNVDAGHTYQSEILDDSYWTNPPTSYVARSTFYSKVDYHDGDYTVTTLLNYEKGDFKIQYQSNDDYIHFYWQGSQVAYTSRGTSIVFGIDEENQLGSIMVIIPDNYVQLNSFCFQNSGTATALWKTSLAYTIVKSLIDVPVGDEIPVIYSDKVNYMSIQSYGEDKCNLRFYLFGQNIYTLSQISKDAYLSMLIDTENQVARTSIIYEGANDTYSYNQEEPTDEEMANLYLWLTVQDNLDEFEGIRESGEVGWEFIDQAKSSVDGFVEEVTITKVT